MYFFGMGAFGIMAFDQSDEERREISIETGFVMLGCINILGWLIFLGLSFVIIIFEGLDAVLGG